MSYKKTAIYLMGPTAAGKTDLALQLSKILPIDIISVDSAMVYRGMNIGTGKPTASELSVVPHALIDIIDPSQSYSAAEFCSDAVIAMQQSVTKKRVPLLVGGTMLYFQALTYGLSDLPAADVKTRQKIMHEADNIGWDNMHNKLQKLDPEIAKKIHPNDPQRIGRALEVIAVSGKKFSEQLVSKNKFISDWDLKVFILAPSNREILHQWISDRFNLMLQDGFIDEVKNLYKQSNLHSALPAMRAVGYRQIWQYLNNEIDFETMVTKSIIATRQLAKRQFTWLRRWDNAVWLESKSVNNIEIILKTIKL